jgi:hypothetical protein
MELAYIAGFFDGEGCVGIRKPSKTATHSAYATIGQNRPEVLRQIQVQFGGNLRYAPQNHVWNYQLSARKAIAFLKAIEPYTIVKKQEILLVLQAFEEMTFNKKAGVPKHLTELRERNRLAVILSRSQHTELNQWALQ